MGMFEYGNACVAKSLHAKRHRPFLLSGDLVRRFISCHSRDWPKTAATASASGAKVAGSPNSPSARRHYLLPITEEVNSSAILCDDIVRSSSRTNGNLSIVSSPYQSNLKMACKYPEMTFGGHIVYSRTYPEVEKATKELLEIIEAKKQNMEHVSLGLDIEWRPAFRRGKAPGKAAVMQICASTDYCYVMHIIHSGIPPILQSLLEDSSSIKVGVGVAQDAKKIMKDYNVCISALEDLSKLANLKLGGVPKMWGLGSLAKMLTCKQLEKPFIIKTSNWAAIELSEKQLQYAAGDAFASWYLYQALRSFPDAADTQDVEEKVKVVTIKKII